MANDPDCTQIAPRATKLNKNVVVINKVQIKATRTDQGGLQLG